MTTAINIRAIEEKDKDWVAEKTKLLWESTTIVSRGKKYEMTDLPGFIAYVGGEPAGFIVYNEKDNQLEIVGILTIIQEQGVGTALVEVVLAQAKEKKHSRVWLVTTNDNLPAMRFYQKRGFRFAALHKNAVEQSRKIKPEIPKKGMHDIPLRDELEFESVLPNNE